MSDYIRYYVLNPMGHVWRKDEYGDIDIFGLDEELHNGPICIKCGYSFCHHCKDGPDEKCLVNELEL